MAIPEALRRRIIEILTHESQRTARVLELIRAEGYPCGPREVRIMAEAIGVELERGPEMGSATGGRPLGSRDRQPRQQREPREGWSQYKEAILRLRAEHPAWSGRAIARELGVSAELVSRYLRTVNK